MRRFAVMSILMIAVAFGIAACKKRASEAPSEEQAAQQAQIAEATAQTPQQYVESKKRELSEGQPVAYGWQGRWNGPEGTFLAVVKDLRGYTITIANLDGPKQYPATPTRDGLRFQRGGVEETIHAGNGADTGMKWLADKTTCLIVKSGEGYCR